MIFGCNGKCATAAALRAEVDHLRGVIDKLLLSQSPGGGAAAILQGEVIKAQPEKRSEPPSPFLNPTISRHPRALAQLAALDLFGRKKR